MKTKMAVMIAILFSASALLAPYRTMALLPYPPNLIVNVESYAWQSPEYTAYMLSLLGGHFGAASHAGSQLTGKIQVSHGGGTFDAKLSGLDLGTFPVIFAMHVQRLIGQGISGILSVTIQFPGFGSIIGKLTQGPDGITGRVDVKVDWNALGKMAINWFRQQIKALFTKTESMNISGEIDFGEPGNTYVATVSGNTTYEFPDVDSTQTIISTIDATDPSILNIEDEVVGGVGGRGGLVVPVDKFGLLAPYIGLASTTMIGAVATVVYARRVKRRKEKQ
jgi:hypothetical protein